MLENLAYQRKRTIKLLISKLANLLLKLQINEAEEHWNNESNKGNNGG
ncbi:unnamed protein product, partial [Vitis vinifera]|uniref:Uncharacterized protein n=1 Tax=Vitis vinifera TaxID=29760 RepID=D7UB53_VITVI